MRYELFKFLRLSLDMIGPEKSGKDSTEYPGMLLPETPSGFKTGYKLVSFFVDPEALLERCYVLRQSGWEDGACLYQRLLVANKISDMRKYLTEQHRVFVNNIIVTLPQDAELIPVGPDGKPLVGKQADKLNQPVSVKLPKALGSIGIIDGQHRLFAYHEGIDTYEKQIASMRTTQHLLVTGIQFPAGMSDLKRSAFEAKLFLEINDKQKRVQSALRQEIQTIVNPYSPVAVAKAVIRSLSDTGPLCGKLEQHFYDTKKIKTASIVSYGLRHIVRVDTESKHSLFRIWRRPGKNQLLIPKSRDMLANYVAYCTQKLNDFLLGFKDAVPDEFWTENKKASRVLTTTTINGLIYCLRLLIAARKTGDVAYYKSHLSNMDIDFTPEGFKYKSSHWKALGEEIYRQCFE
jgi:DGQHR domain-containing protein